MTDLVVVLYGGIVRGASLSQFKKKKSLKMKKKQMLLDNVAREGISEAKYDLEDHEKPNLQN